MEDIKLKITKLLNLARDKGASENEAATAMAMASKLMIAHGIKEAELQQSEQVAGRSENTELERDWQEVIAQTAGNLFGCMTLFLKSREKPVFYFIGRPENHSAAAQTFNYLCDQVERLYKTSLPRGLSQRDRANYRRTFKYSCAVRIYHRAEELIDEMKRGEHAESTGGNALVVQGYFDKLADEVDNFLKKTGMNVRVKRSKPRSAGLCTAAGRVAGDNVNLRSAIR